MNFFIRILRIIWRDYFYDPARAEENRNETEIGYPDEESALNEAEAAFEPLEMATPERKREYKRVIRETLKLFDWLCAHNRFIFIFNEECGRTNLHFVIDLCHKILGQTLAPIEPANKDSNVGNIYSRAVDQKASERKFELFAFTEIGAIL